MTRCDQVTDNLLRSVLDVLDQNGKFHATAQEYEQVLRTISTAVKTATRSGGPTRRGGRKSHEP